MPAAKAQPESFEIWFVRLAAYYAVRGWPGALIQGDYREYYHCGFSPAETYLDDTAHF